MKFLMAVASLQPPFFMNLPNAFENQNHCLDPNIETLVAISSLLIKETDPKFTRERLARGESKQKVWGAKVADEIERTFERLQKLNAKITYPGATDYPELFYHLKQPPRFLSYIGESVWKQKRGLSIVGSRDPSRNTTAWLDENLTDVLRRRDLFVASGGARGVDQCAHRISLIAGRPTLAFLPSGLGDIFPCEFKDWVMEIKAGGGAVLSEYAPNAQMFRGHFQRRNRMIAAIGTHLFVAQAARKSGSLITARQALELGRPIAVLPASPLDHRSLGGLDLLFDGAQILRDRLDFECFLNS